MMPFRCLASCSCCFMCLLSFCSTRVVPVRHVMLHGMCGFTSWQIHSKGFMESYSTRTLSTMITLLRNFAAETSL